MNTLIATVIAVVGALAITYAWYNALALAWLSEKLWTLFNTLLGGTRPGYAADLEFVTVFLGSTCLLFFASRAAVRRLRQR